MQGGGTRLDRIVKTIVGHDADTLVLTEVTRARLGSLQVALAAHGYAHVVAATPPALGGGILIASRQRFDIRESRCHIVDEDFRWTEVYFAKAQFTLAGIYFPDTRDAIAAFWPPVLRAADVLRDEPVLLVGDFNSGQSHFDVENDTISSDPWFTAMPFHGLHDLWRHDNGDKREYTWFSRGSRGTKGRQGYAPKGFRIDHAFGTLAMRRRVRRAWYSHAERERGESDHSSLLIDVR